MGPNPLWLVSCKKREVLTGETWGELQVIVEAETGCSYKPRMDGHPLHPKTGRRKERFSQEPLEGAWPCWHLTFGLLAFWTGVGYISIVFKPPRLWYFIMAAWGILHNDQSRILAFLPTLICLPVFYPLFAQPQNLRVHIVPPFLSSSSLHLTSRAWRLYRNTAEAAPSLQLLCILFTSCLKSELPVRLSASPPAPGTLSHQSVMWSLAPVLPSPSDLCSRHPSCLSFPYSILKA